MRRKCSDANRNIKKVGVVPIRKVMFNVSSVGPFSERNIIISDEGPTLETFDITFRISSTPTFFIFRFVPILYLRSTLRLLLF